ncbi:hypothetical protein [Pararhizobium mangrovi]|uniref:Uncharacterized protein n=1 Tax=Pararhizobium mangrovi TaxID=2590452 RepID=A0A506UHF3_9HYPH|nr:hypothetical protein [Pararhizobium mangrovi]TPW32744.1 hypothetical protein FJU11_00520 [Pararhizobium mangrovi]
MADVSNSISTPRDNRTPKVRLTDDALDLSRMASIAFKMLEKAFDPSRAVAYQVGGTCTFHFDDSSLDDMHFALGDVLDRSRSVASRLEDMQDAEPVQPPARAIDTATGFKALADLEGSLHVASSLLDALDELSGEVDDPKRRLNSICAIAGNLGRELDVAKAGVRQLFEHAQPI